MICNCPSCQKAFDIQTAGRYSCDGCGNAFNAGASPVTQPQPISVSAMSHGDVKRICETMWTCTLWIIFAPLVLGSMAGAVFWIIARVETNRSAAELNRQMQNVQRLR